MILFWDNARSFQRHLEDMGRFRRSHAGIEGVIRAFHDMPTIFDIDPVDNPERFGAFGTVRGRPIVVPIWDIDLPAGSRN